jgi:trypsin
VTAVALVAIVWTLIPQIIGGTPVTSITTYPYALALKLRSTPRNIYCGGALVARDWILTAAHCMNGLSTSDIIVEGDTVILNRGEERSIDRFCRHPRFSGPEPYRNDLAMLHLSSRFTYATPVPRSVLPPRLNVTALGWGLTQYGVTSPVLLEVTAAVEPNFSCNVNHSDLRFRFNIKNDHVCFGSDTKGLCQGDSGGPIVDPLTDKLIAVASDAPSTCGVANGWSIGARLDETFIKEVIDGTTPCNNVR